MKRLKKKVEKTDVVPDKDEALKMIRRINEWAFQCGAELRIDESGNLKAVVELK